MNGETTQGFITLREAAELLGMSERTLRYRIKIDDCPKCYRPGKQYRFLPAECVEWMRSHAFRAEKGGTANV